MLPTEKKKGKNGIAELCLVQRRKKKGKVAFLSFAMYREGKKGKSGNSELCFLQRRKKGKVALLKCA